MVCTQACYMSNDGKTAQQDEIEVILQHNLGGTDYLTFFAEKTKHALTHSHGFTGLPQPTTLNTLKPVTPLVCHEHQQLGVSMIYKRCPVAPARAEMALQERIAQISDASQQHRDATNFLYTHLPRTSRHDTPILYSPQIFIGEIHDSISCQLVTLVPRETTYK